MAKTYANYMDDVSEDVKRRLEDMKCQPILLVGSGLSRRYFGAPDWRGLLEQMAAGCPEIQQEVAYLSQLKKTLPQIAQIYAEQYREWAWHGGGRDQFPNDLFDPMQPSDIYLKYKVAEYFESVVPQSVDDIKKG